MSILKPSPAQLTAWKLQSGQILHKNKIVCDVDGWTLSVHDYYPITLHKYRNWGKGEWSSYHGCAKNFRLDCTIFDLAITKRKPFGYVTYWHNIAKDCSINLPLLRAYIAWFYKSDQIIIKKCDE